VLGEGGCAPTRGWEGRRTREWKKGQPSFRQDFILFRVEIEIDIVEKYIKKFAGPN
jgi:hypothetical protein